MIRIDAGSGSANAALIHSLRVCSIHLKFLPVLTFSPALPQLKYEIWIVSSNTRIVAKCSDIAPFVQYRPRHHLERWILWKRMGMWYEYVAKARWHSPVRRCLR